MILADFGAATPTDVGLWIAILGGVLGIVWLVLQIWEKVSPRPVPPLDEKYATKKELEDAYNTFEKWMRELTSRIDANRVEVRGEIIEVMRRSTESNEKIHERINDILEAVSELKGKVS